MDVFREYNSKLIIKDSKVTNNYNHEMLSIFLNDKFSKLKTVMNGNISLLIYRIGSINNKFNFRYTNLKKFSLIIKIIK